MKTQWDRASAVVIYAAFALTGFATALMGATLPVMQARWAMTDRQCGVLFLVLFFGASLGGQLSRGRPAASLARGCALLGPACGALAFAWGRAVLPAAFLYGLGLGVTITSISLLRSARCAETRAREMNRLNLIWACGAFSCPSLANAALRMSGVRTLLCSLAVLFGVLLVWTLWIEMGKMPVMESRAKTLHRNGLRLPLAVAGMTLFAVGLESATGAWVATYALRLRHDFEAPVTAASIFWLGLLANRALHSTRVVDGFSERVLLRIDVAIAALGCGLLACATGSGLLLVAAWLIGFGVGPVYPLLMAAVLPRVAGNMIFMVAGFGGTLFPLMTGALSTRAGSLRVGMLVPAVTGFAMLGLVPWVSRRLKEFEG